MKKISERYVEVTGDDRESLKGYQIDIAIIDWKIAIEYHGQWHFRPIMGQKNLDRVKRSDARKKKILEELGWELIIVENKRIKNDTKDTIKRKFNKVVKKKLLARIS